MVFSFLIAFLTLIIDLVTRWLNYKQQCYEYSAVGDIIIFEMLIPIYRLFEIMLSFHVQSRYHCFLNNKHSFHDDVTGNRYYQIIAGFSLDIMVHTYTIICWYFFYKTHYCQMNHSIFFLWYYHSMHNSLGEAWSMYIRHAKPSRFSNYILYLKSVF